MADITVKSKLHCEDCSHKDVCRITDCDFLDSYVSVPDALAKDLTIDIRCAHYRKIQNPFGESGIRWDPFLKEAEKEKNNA